MKNAYINISKLSAIEQFMRIKMWDSYAASRLERAARLLTDKRMHTRYAELFHTEGLYEGVFNTPSCSCSGSADSKAVPSIKGAIDE